MHWSKHAFHPVPVKKLGGILAQWGRETNLQYIPRNMHKVFASLCFVVVIHWLIFPYPSGLLHWHCGNLTIAPVPAKQPWWIWINTSCDFIMNDCITTTKQSTTKPCAYFLGYTVGVSQMGHCLNKCCLTGPNETKFYEIVFDNCIVSFEKMLLKRHQEIWGQFVSTLMC